MDRDHADDARTPEGLPPHDDALDEQDVRRLLDDPDADPVALITAFRYSSAHPPLRDALLLHPRVADVDLYAEVEAWPAVTRERAMSVTDQVAANTAWGQSPDPFERAVAAMNPHCPTALAEALAEDLHPGVRANAAGCPHLSPGTRARLAHRDPDDGVRSWAAWLIATAEGRELISGNRCGQFDEEGPVVRVITFDMDRVDRPPV